MRRSPKVFVPAVGGRQIVIPFRPLSVVLIVVLSILSGFLFLRSDIFQIKEIDFDSGGVPDEALVRQRVMEEVLARSIFFLDPSAVEAKIKESFLAVSAVSIQKELPDKVHVKISVRKPLAIVEDKNKARFLVDGEGLLFQQATKESLPVIKLGEDFEGSLGLKLSVSEQGISSYLKTLDIVASKGLKTKAIYLHSGTIELILKKTTVWLDSGGDINEQLELLTQILQRYSLSGRTPRMVDLRFSRPVVRL